MAEQIQLQLLIDTANSAKSVGEVKSALKNIQGELLNIKDTGSKEFRELAATAGQLKDRMGDAQASIAAFTPEGKFQSIANAASGIASGFQAAQGAMALFGSEGKEIEKVLLKVQSATAVAQGLQGVAGLGDALGNMRNVIKASAAQFLAWIGVVEGATVAQNLLNVATKAFQALTSPIGIAITAVTAVVAVATKAWYDEKEAIEANNKALERNKKIHDDVLKSELSNWDKVRELQNQRKQGRDKELSEELLSYQREIKALGDSNNLTQSQQKIKEELIANHLFNVQQINKKFDDEAKKKAEELRKAKELEDAKKKEAELFIREKAKEEEAKALEDEQAANQKIADMNLEREKINNENTKTAIADLDAAEVAAHKARLERNANEAAAEQALVQQKIANANASLQIASDVTNGLAAVGSMFIKDSEKMKKFQQRIALAQLAIDSGKALASAVAASAANPGNAVTFGGAGVAQYIAAAAQILSNIAKARQMIKGADSGTPPSLSTSAPPSVSTKVPQAPSFSSTQQRVGAQQQQGDAQFQQQSQLIKVYVTETDITNSQKRVGTIEQRATIK